MGRIYITMAKDMGNLTVCLRFSDDTERMVDVADSYRTTV